MMLNCKQVTRLVSESLDRDLPLGKRIGVWLHFRICRYCVRYRRHLRYLRRLMQFQREEMDREPPPPDAPHLAPEARERIRQRLLTS